LHDIGGFNESLTISQDYDLILRAAEKARNIVHIPEILYLWRQLPTSAGHLLQEKVMKTSASILEEHSRRIHADCEVGPGVAFNFFKRRPKIDLEKCSTAIVILTKNQAPLLRQCVESLERTLPEKLPHRIVIVDHDSNEPDAVELLAGYARKHTVVPYNGTFNYAAQNNFGVRHGAGDAEFLLFCNNDIEVTEPQWMERLLEAAADEKVGAVAPLMLYPDRDTIQHAGVSVGLCGPAEHLGKFLASHDAGGGRLPGYQGMLWVTREVAAITTACALFRRRAYEAVGGFNEELQVGFNDTDLCLRLWQSDYRVLYCGETSIIHHESASRGKSFTHDPHPADSRRFLDAWGWLISRGDPFYNPNLRSDSTSWESAFVPERTAKPKLRRYSGPASMFIK
jgi:GT2 family glycosyltransferase